jgi:hypothetical protein
MFEDYAINKYPKKGKCPNSTFKAGWHRAGMVPVESLLDGGMAGDICKEICLECEKVFANQCFVMKRQPSIIKNPLESNKP